MGQQMDKRAELLICCTRGKKNSLATPRDKRKREEDRESNTKTRMYSKKKENKRRWPDPDLTTMLLTVTHYKAANMRPRANR